MAGLVLPHGGRLSPLLVHSDEREGELKEAKIFPAFRLSSREVSDLIMLAMGAFSPLDGFIGKEDYQRVVAEMRLKGGLLWPIPITLSISKEEANKIKGGQKIGLIGSDRDEVPLEWCFGDGVWLDLRWKKPREDITDGEVQQAVAEIRYVLKPMDIVLIKSETVAYYGQPECDEMNAGMTREATRGLGEHGCFY